MKNKNIIYILSLMLVIGGCASTVSFNKELDTKNIALIKDTVFNPVFSIKSKSATVTKIDGKKTNYSSFSHELIAGKHKLLTECTYYETSSLIYTNEHILDVNLVKGHTYKIVPILIADDIKKKVTCMSKLNDLTKI